MYVTFDCICVVYVSDKHESHVCVVVWVSNSKKNNVTNKNRELVVGPQVKKKSASKMDIFPSGTKQPAIIDNILLVCGNIQRCRRLQRCKERSNIETELNKISSSGESVHPGIYNKMWYTWWSKYQYNIIVVS